MAAADYYRGFALSRNHCFAILPRLAVREEIKTGKLVEVPVKADALCVTNQELYGCRKIMAQTQTRTNGRAGLGSTKVISGRYAPSALAASATSS